MSSCPQHVTRYLVLISFIACCFASFAQSATQTKESSCACGQVAADTWSLCSQMDKEANIHDQKSRERYLQKLDQLEQTINTCLANRDSLNSIKRLALKRAKNLIGYKRAHLQHLKPLKAIGASGRAAECGEVCNEWKRQNDIYRNRQKNYQKFVAMDETGLHCREAINDLEEYDAGQGAAPLPGEKTVYKKEEIEALLLTIYAIIKADDEACIAEGLELIQKIIVRSPGNFLKIFEELWRGLDDGSRHEIINIISVADSRSLYDMAALFQVLNKKDQRERAVLIDMITGLEWSQLVRVSDAKAIDLTKIMRISYLMVTDEQEILHPDKEIQAINRCLPEAFSRRLGLINTHVELTTAPRDDFHALSIRALDECKVGNTLFVKEENSPTHGDRSLAIVGGVSSGPDSYLLRLRFLSDKGMVLFAKNIRIEKNKPHTDEKGGDPACDILDGEIGNTLHDFRNFLSIFQLFPGGGSLTGNTQAYIANTALISNIQTQIHSRKEALQKYDGVLIKKDFWDDPMGNAIFGKSIHDRIYTRINANYFHTRLNGLLLDRIKPGCMIVSGRLLETPIQAKPYDGGESGETSAITLSFTNDDQTIPLRKITFFFPRASLADKKAIETLHEEIEGIVTMTLADIFDLIPQRSAFHVPAGGGNGPISGPTLITPLTKEPESLPENRLMVSVRSFFIPGYARTTHGQQLSGPIQVWNMSSSILGALSLGAAMYYMNTDYEQEWAYTASAILGYGFCINGAIGMIDGFLLGKPRDMPMEKAGGIHLNWAADGPLVMMSHAF